MKCFDCGYDGEMKRERKAFQTGAAKGKLTVYVCPECGYNNSL